ncbi:MAG: hypothetical protein ACLT2T_06490 [Bilophila wadsworthia]
MANLDLAIFPGAGSGVPVRRRAPSCVRWRVRQGAQFWEGIGYDFRMASVMNLQTRGRRQNAFGFRQNMEWGMAP